MKTQFLSTFILTLIFTILSATLEAQNVGIGNTSPTEKLDVTGNIKTTGEIKPNGMSGTVNQVLTSNGNGTMQWAAASNNSGEENTGNGTWGDCSVNSITDFQPVANEDGGYDNFGRSASISGDYAIVGSYLDDEGSGLLDNGSATIYKRNTSTGVWEAQLPKLTNPSPVNSDYFGFSVSISGDYAIVGSYFDDEGSGFIDNGSATIFKRNTSTGAWEAQLPKLTNPIPANNDFFGLSVSISGDYAIVGSYGDDEGSGLIDNGSATIFKRNTSTGVWEAQLPKLTNPSPANSDYFGISVSISGDYAIVGSNFDDEGSGLFDNGSATIFKRNTSTGVWEAQLPKLTNTSPADSDYFGGSVSISGDYAIVGSNNDDEGSGLIDNGSATIFKRNTSTGVWEAQLPKLTNSSTGNYDFFGYPVSISGDYAILGSNADDEGSGLIDNGSATIYRRYGNIWRVVQKFTHPGSVNYDHFGFTTAIDSSGRFVVGASGIASMGMAFFGKVK